MKLVYFGHPVLREKSKAVAEITDEIRVQVARMLEMCNEYNGIGLASNQVGIPLRIFVTRVVDYNEDGTPIEHPPKVYINPELSDPTDQRTTMEEGCLSIPGLRVPIQRPHGITIKALNLQGEEFIETLEGLEARCVMHENDHINGVLMMDRTDIHSRKAAKPILQQIKKKYS